MKKLILASGSPRRRDILKRQGIAFDIIKSTIEEHSDKSRPDEVVMDLSRQKAEAVYAGLDEKQRQEYSMILSADTVVAADGCIRGKPADREEAERMLRLLSGREHQVYTGFCLLDARTGQLLINEAECTLVRVYELEDEEIGRYIDSGEPMDKAGAYGIQGLFSYYIRGIEGDYDNVVGLPIARIYQECKALGISL